MKMLARFSLLLLSFSIFYTACLPERPQPLPILGTWEVVDGDTIYHTIPDFAFIDQDSQLITNETFVGKVYVVDFFFIHCPTICPITAREMKRIHDHFIDDDRVLLVSHTVDPKRDTVAALKRYARNLGVKPGKWFFLTGDKDAIYEIADDYFSVALEDPDSPGGFDHSGRFVLVDANRHIRSFCNGTDSLDVKRFIGDIERLLKMEYSKP